MDLENLDLTKVQPKFESLLTAMSYKLEREFPAKFGRYDSAQITFMLRFRISLNTYNAILFLCADIPKDPHRKPSFALAVPPMVRTLFEELITIIFLLHDTGRYLDYFYKTVYNAKKRELDHAQKYHAGEPLFEGYIQNLQDVLEKMEKKHGMTEAEFKKIGRYPSVGKMVSRLRLDFPDSNVLTFLDFIRNWLYRDLSGQTHLDIQGFQDKSIYFAPKKVANQIFGQDYKTILSDQIKTYKAVQIFTTITLLLALMTEMNRAFNFDLALRLEEIWQLVKKSTNITRLIYEKRYSEILLESFGDQLLILKPKH